MANNEQYVNDPGTTLNGSINNSVTSLVVTSATGYPSGGNFRILLESEIMIVTAVSGTTWTVTRGAESTTAASHASGVIVNHILTAGGIDAIRGNESGIDLYANLPTNSLKLGDRFVPTDATGNYEYVYNGSSWIPFLRINNGITQPPTASIWGWLNQGTATLTDLAGGGLQFVSRTDNQLSAITKTAPSTPYTITIGFNCIGVGPTVGMVFYDSGGGKLVLFHWSSNNTTGPVAFSTSKWNSLTSFSNVYVNGNTGVTANAGMMFLRVTDDGTNLKYYYGCDLNTFSQFDSRLRHDWLGAGPTHYGIHCGATLSNQPVIYNIYHHKQT